MSFTVTGVLRRAGKTYFSTSMMNDGIYAYSKSIILFRFHQYTATIIIANKFFKHINLSAKIQGLKTTRSIQNRHNILQNRHSSTLLVGAIDGNAFYADHLAILKPFSDGGIFTILSRRYAGAGHSGCTHVHASVFVSYEWGMHSSSVRRTV
jgi:hypothetical protein